MPVEYWFDLIQICFIIFLIDDERSTDGDSLRNSLYASHGETPRFRSRKFCDKKTSYDDDPIQSLKTPQTRKATEIIDCWTWGNQPGKYYILNVKKKMSITFILSRMNYTNWTVLFKFQVRTNSKNVWDCLYKSRWSNVEMFSQLHYIQPEYGTKE